MILVFEKDLPYGFESKNKEILQEILNENQEEMQAHSELFKSMGGGLFMECQDISKLPDSANRRMKDIKEEEEEISSLSNSKLEDLPRFKKSEFSMETPLKRFESKESGESKEETLKLQITVIYRAILDKFKGTNPYSIYMELVIFFKVMRKFYLKKKESKVC